MSSAYPPPPPSSGSYGSQPPVVVQPYGGQPPIAAPYASPGAFPPPQSQHSEHGDVSHEKKPYRATWKMITSIVIASICFILVISATASTWSLIEYKFGNEYNFKFFLDEVKREKTSEKTWDSYDKFVDDNESSSKCKTMAENFRNASDAARGTLFLPYAALLVFLVMSVISIMTKMAKRGMNLIAFFSALGACFAVFLPSSAWSGEVPDLDGIADCFAIGEITYYASHNGPWLLWVSGIMMIFATVFVFIEIKHAKKHYAD